MEFEKIKELISIVNSSELTFFEYETADTHLKLDKSLTRGVSNSNIEKEFKKDMANNVGVINSAPTVNEVSVNSEVTPVKDEKESGIAVKSPMVGTFYSSPSPEKDAFVSVGDEVKQGDVLCIIEAMKLMNEIESEVNGTVKKVLVKDGEMVEYGQPLFMIEEN